MWLNGEFPCGLSIPELVISGTRTEVSSSPPLPKNLPFLRKSSQPTLESSSFQTTEPIVKFHTILEMGSHDESAHTFRSSLWFLEVPPKRGLKKSYLWCHHRPASHMRESVVISCSSLWRQLWKSSSLQVNSWLQMFEIGDQWRRTNCTVLYCTVPWSTVPSQLFLREGSF